MKIDYKKVPDKLFEDFYKGKIVEDVKCFPSLTGKIVILYLNNGARIYLHKNFIGDKMAQITKRKTIENDLKEIIKEDK